MKNIGIGNNECFVGDHLVSLPVVSCLARWILLCRLPKEKEINRSTPPTQGVSQTEFETELKQQLDLV
ncbi:hypothetical protein ACROYT_G018407 [Oculina patagonica]